MAALTEPVKLALVRALACFDSPSEAADLVKQEFGVEVRRQQAAAYDPTKAAGKNLSPKLALIFHSTRTAFLAQISVVPIAHQAYRLRALQRLLDKAKERGNIALACQILEQAAKEVGGVFTNRRELTGKGGAPISQYNVTPEQLAAQVRSVRKDEAAATYARFMLAPDPSTRDLTDDELAQELRRHGLEPPRKELLC